ncbi:YihY/virulence factor BrkB family protein [Lamprobacter modestohalophilus]|uniref:YihY/virulence factor BrkB family protein n=1 Tax=Lamprobacter modestohalophilus TaxID=1064514 RepID=UPI002ADEBA97|nr:YihY/virulence factor BrkB family protein [Lamprobacter modestohalophilus]MEA1052121.1 YihY/virulence factor BrkB family protein [Lamprobacter modestohalophilus]
MQSAKTAEADTQASTSAPGRAAESPWVIPGRGWWQIARRVGRRFMNENLGLVAAGVGFYSLLALFPAIVALVTIYDLVFDVSQIQSQFDALGGLLPAQVHDLISARLESAAESQQQTLSFGLAGAVLLSFWGATRGTRALIIALNIAYDEQEERNLFLLNLMAFGLTIFLVLVLAVAIIATVAVPIIINLVSLGTMPEVLAAWLRWPLLALVGLFALGMLYRYGPSRRAARWRWLPPGSLVAGVLWLAASGLFSFYVANFGAYNATYGSLGAVIVLLLWLYLSATAVIVGASINAETERQTRYDSTIGEAKPRGERGAEVADRLPGE